MYNSILHVKHLLRHFLMWSFEARLPLANVEGSSTRSHGRRAVIILEVGAEMELGTTTNKLRES
jgi:hypothetical protein